MASCHTHAPLFPTFIPLLLPLHALLFPRSPHLFFSSYSLLLSSASTDADARNGRRGCSYRPTRMLVSTDADARIDRRGCSYRPTRMLVTTDADARIDRRGCSYRSARMSFVDVSQCQTFTFVLPNLYFRSAKLLLSCSQIVAFVAQNLPFHISLPLFLAISSPVFLDQ